MAGQARRSLWLTLGGLSGASAVGLGAYSSHGLASRVEDEDALEMFKLIHSMPLAACAFLPPPFGNIAGVFFLSGISLFSGGLYAAALTGDRGKGKYAAVGGMSLMAGWIALAFSKVPK